MKTFFTKLLLTISTFLLILISGIPAITHADATTPYTLQYTANNTVFSFPYSTYEKCIDAKSKIKITNANPQCIPKDSTVEFYCYSILVRQDFPNGPTQKFCYQDANTCHDESGNAPGTIDSCDTAQNTDDSGIKGDLNTLLPSLQAKQASYQFLAPLSDGNGQSFTNPDLVSYVKGMYRFIIALAGIIAVIMIIVGGLMYMSTDAISKKRSGKDIIIRTLWGILLLFGSYLILYTINPTLVQIQTPNIGTASGIANINSGPTSSGTPGSPTTPTGPKTSWCFTPYVKGINTVPFTGYNLNCKPTENECIAAAGTFLYNKDYFVTASKKGIGNGKYCYPSDTGNYATSQWCVDINVESTNIGPDCSAGNAYTINPAALEKVNEKIRGYKDGKYVSAGDSATVLTHADANTSAVDPDGDYEYYVDSNTNKVCITVQHSNGLGRVEDCSTSEGADAIMGYTFDTHTQSICESKAQYWDSGDGHQATFLMGTGNGTAGTSGQWCQ